MSKRKKLNNKPAMMSEELELDQFIYADVAGILRPKEPFGVHAKVVRIVNPCIATSSFFSTFSRLCYGLEEKFGIPVRATDAKGIEAVLAPVVAYKFNIASDLAENVYTFFKAVKGANLELSNASTRITMHMIDTLFCQGGCVFVEMSVDSVALLSDINKFLQKSLSPYAPLADRLIKAAERTDAEHVRQLSREFIERAGFNSLRDAFWDNAFRSR
jgi:hypothetical protein